jgi:hypothetical protein
MSIFFIFLVIVIPIAIIAKIFDPTKWASIKDNKLVTGEGQGSNPKQSQMATVTGFLTITDNSGITPGNKYYMFLKRCDPNTGIIHKYKVEISQWEYLRKYNKGDQIPYGG